ncbi:MAG: exopolyphosphatase, partial [Pseudomonadota bacterium]
IALRDRIISFGHVDRVQLDGLSSTRQPVISGGVVIIEACMRAFKIEQMAVSPFALREGLLYDLFGRMEQTDPRDKTVRAMAQRHEVDQSQAERVRDLALCAFEHLAESHALNASHRDLLEWTCQLHEIGLVIAHSHYQLHSGYIVEHADLPGFTQQEQQYMACLLRNQRRKLTPQALDALPARLRTSARSLLLILRFSVALARGRSDADLPDFSIQSDAPEHWQLALPVGWLEAHPLTARSLEFEQLQLEKLGLRTALTTLAAPEPLAS